MSEPVNFKNYFENYTSLVQEKNVLEAFAAQEEGLRNFLQSISEEKSFYSYAAGKWSLKEMLQHIIDTERIFAYRALAIARKETVTLPGFDENIYAENAMANKRTWLSLSNEMMDVRKSTNALFQSFNEEMLQHSGNFSSSNGSVNTIGFIVIGHLYHHINIANERYF